MAGTIVIQGECIIDAPTTDEAIKLYRKTIGFNDSIKVEKGVTIKVRGKRLVNQPQLDGR